MEELIRKDRILWGYSPARAAEILWAFDGYFERLFRSPVKLVVTTGIAYSYQLLMLRWGQAVGVPVVSLYPARSQFPRFVASTGLGDEPILRPGRPAETLETQTYGERLGDAGPAVLARELVHRARQRRQRRRTPVFYLYKAPAATALDVGVQKARGRALKAFVRLESDASAYMGDPNVIVFPLHVHPEAATLILDRGHGDQVATILELKRRHTGARIVAKLHPHRPGNMPVKGLRALQDAGVDLFNGPWSWDGFSGRVVGLSSTFLIEAAAHGAPTYMLGTAFFKEMGGVVADADLDLRGTPQDGPTYEELLLRHSWPGLFGVCKNGAEARVLSNDNVQQVAAGLREVCERFS